MSESKTTILFDVGGRVYKVGRSLLDSFPNTMLARAASDEWKHKGKDNDSGNDDDDNPIFLDCDSERFRYCLDYMRHGKVSLPITESKSALLAELSYYGFEDVQPNMIDCSNAIAEAATSLVEYGKKGTEEALLYSKTVAKLEEVKTYAFFAQELHDNVTKESKLDFGYVWQYLGPAVPRGTRKMYTCTGQPTRYASRDLFGSFDRTLLNECLSKFSLQVGGLTEEEASVHRYSYSLKLDKVTP